MNLIALSIGVLYAMALAALGLGCFTLIRSHWLAHSAEERAGNRADQAEAALAGLCAEVEACRDRVRELEQQAAASPLAPGPRAGMNLSKRSQALRLHRRGDPPEQIAAALEIPHQEVDLLLKVHRIVVGDL